MKCVEDLTAAMMSLCACEGMKVNKSLVKMVDENVNPALFHASADTACQYHKDINRPEGCALSRAKKIL